MKKANECFRCTSTKCHCHIYTDDNEFDEVACDEHIHGLERLADKWLNGAVRTHDLGTSLKSRKKRSE